MNRRTKTYLILVALFAAVVMSRQEWRVFTSLPQEHLLGIVFLIGLAFLSEVLPVMYTVGNQKASSSIGFLPFFACVLLFPLPVALLVATSTSALSQVLIRRGGPLRTLFNIGQTALSLVLAVSVFNALGGKHGVPVQQSMLTAAGFLRVGAFAGTFFFVNQAFVAVALALSSGERISLVFTRVMGPAGANLLYDILVSPIAIVFALLYGYLHVVGLLIVLLPLLIIRHSYASSLALQRANKDLLSVLVKTIETRDPYTSGHSIRVSILARTIAEDMNLSAGQIDRIETTALVHDIGKVDVVYASIIRKEGGLSDSERKVIVTHAAKGADFLKTLSSFKADVIDGVRHHHERYDGSGYPNGLSGEAIPLAARIIQLCDSIDAMLSDRPYRKALPLEHVRSELIRCAGTQFDPRIVEVILRRNTLERAASLVRPDGMEKRTLLVATA